MTVQISDTFDNVHGFSDYDTDYLAQPINAHVATNRHIDVRIFDTVGITRPRTMLDLDGDAMSDLDTTPMSELDAVVVVPGEHWADYGGSTGATLDVAADGTYGTTGGIGKFAIHKGWRSAKLTCDGAALAYALESTWPTGGGSAIQVDITPFDTFSVLVDQSAMAVARVTAVSVQFNNDPNGAFGGATDSSVYALTQSGSEWTNAVTTLTADVNCNMATITGMRIYLHDDNTHHPVAGDKIYVLGVRAYTTGYNPGATGDDINTKRGAAVPSIPFDLSDVHASVQPMIRGTTGDLASDPRPIDATTRLHIKPGALAFSSNGSRSIAQLFFRDDRASQNIITTQLEAYNGAIQWRLTERVAGVVTSAAVSPTVISSGGTWTTFLSTYDYWVWEVTVKGTAVRAKLYASDANGSLRSVFYDSGLLDIGLTKKRGRVGWGLAYNLDRDFQFFNFSGFGLAYSTLITAPANSYYPVDGVQLIAAFSQDDNLFTEFTGTPTPVLDTQRTISADGSFRGTGPMASNSFSIQADPEQAYLSFDMWVPSQVAASNQPRIVLRGVGTSTPDVILPPLELQGNQWNHIEIELGESALLIGVIYRLFIERAEGQGTTYEWNVDNMVIGQRNVRWSACADGTDNWIEFRDTVNDEAGALHFPHDRRGNQLQIKAEALTTKAWIAPFTFKPHTAELGKPKYLP